MDHEDVDAALRDSASPWVRADNVLVFERRFDTYAEGIAFVDAVARAADAMNHHPDISVRYTLVRLELSTHDAGGITSLDLELAGTVSRL